MSHAQLRTGVVCVSLILFTPGDLESINESFISKIIIADTFLIQLENNNIIIIIFGGLGRRQQQKF